MRIDIPELMSLPADERQSIIDAASRSVNATHGRMGNAPHYVGAALVAGAVLWGLWAGHGLVWCVSLGVLLYFGVMAVGVVGWQWSMAVAVKQFIRSALAARAGV
jgi:hypothetical protein